MRMSASEKSIVRLLASLRDGGATKSSYGGFVIF